MTAPRTPLDDKLQTGERLELGRHTFEPDEIKQFAGKYDPQRFHLSEEEAARSVFGRLCASGWHTLSIWMRCNVASYAVTNLRDGEALEFGPSPGLRDIRWLKPVFAGDTITFYRTVTGHRAHTGRRGWHIVTNVCEAENQHGEPVMRFDSAVLLKVDRDAEAIL